MLSDQRIGSLRRPQVIDALATGMTYRRLAELAGLPGRAFNENIKGALRRLRLRRRWVGDVVVVEDLAAWAGSSDRGRPG